LQSENVEKDQTTNLAEEELLELPRKKFSDQELFAKDWTSEELLSSKAKKQKELWEIIVKELQLKNVEMVQKTNLAEEELLELPRKKSSDQELFAKDWTSEELLSSKKELTPKKSSSKEHQKELWEIIVKELQLENVEMVQKTNLAEEELLELPRKKVLRSRTLCKRLNIKRTVVVKSKKAKRTLRNYCKRVAVRKCGNGSENKDCRVRIRKVTKKKVLRSRTICKRLNIRTTVVIKKVTVTHKTKEHKREEKKFVEKNWNKTI